MLCSWHGVQRNMGQTHSWTEVALHLEMGEEASALWVHSFLCS